MADAIRIQKLRVNNLQGIDLELPLGRLIAICGPSGSGKSTLAFDALYTEGMRRYLETLSAHERRRLPRFEKPLADRLDHLPVPVALPRQSAVPPREVLAQAMDLLHPVRVLFARHAVCHCPVCGQPMVSHDPASAARALVTQWPESRAMIGYVPTPAEGTSLQNALAAASHAGFQRGIFAGRVFLLADRQHLAALATGQECLVICDRVKFAEEQLARVREAVEAAFDRGQGLAVALVQAESAPAPAGAAAATSEGGIFHNSERIDGAPWLRATFARYPQCGPCQSSMAPLEIHQLDAAHPDGACPHCQGTGQAPAVMQENGPRGKSKLTLAVVSGEPCNVCGGNKLRAETNAWQLCGQTFLQVQGQTPGELINWCQQVAAQAAESPATLEITQAMQLRLASLQELGLDYLPVNRGLQTLSSGELRRVMLAKLLASQLVDLLYIVDEPCAHLHAAENSSVIAAVRRLQSRGNTVIAIEHEQALLEQADLVAEIGPGAGTEGGRLTFLGEPSALRQSPQSVTAAYWRGERAVCYSKDRRPANKGCLTLNGACGHNLKNVHARFPLGLFCVVSGVSGAGKSSLVTHTLYKALAKELSGEKLDPLVHAAVHGANQLGDVVLMDQTPLVRSTRSNPAMILKAWDEIRDLFAQSAEAKLRGLSPSHFSFNVEGGRCETCRGTGLQEVNMQFLADVVVTCPDCHGRRFKPEVLAVHHRGRSIADVLEMTAKEAFAFFRGQRQIQTRLGRLIEVGLDYLTLGQPAHSLSGGESQRLRLAMHLAAATKSRSLFIMEEPSAGLHACDLPRLLDCIDALIAVGHSVIAIEHRLEIIAHADHLIDLGPGAGASGGQIIAEGTPEQVAACGGSLTGEQLRRVLQ